LSFLRNASRLLFLGFLAVLMLTTDGVMLSATFSKAAESVCAVATEEAIAWSWGRADEVSAKELPAMLTPSNIEKLLLRRGLILRGQKEKDKAIKRMFNKISKLAFTPNNLQTQVQTVFFKKIII
jgi:hypothetical protein